MSISKVLCYNHKETYICLHMKRLLRFPVQLLFGSAWGEEGWEWGTVLQEEYRTPEWLTVWAFNWNVFLLFQHAGHVTITDGTVSMMDLRWSLSFVSPKHSQTVSSSWGKKTLIFIFRAVLSRCWPRVYHNYGPRLFSKRTTLQTFFFLCFLFC